MSTGQTFLAKALYDNLAESPDELAFRRGDIITVVERNTDGLDGWWLCNLRGKQGIVPGNRLKLITGMQPGCSFTQLDYRYDNFSQSPSPIRAVSSTLTRANRRSYESTPVKVVVPQRTGDTYDKNSDILDYDIPPIRSLPAEVYDVPKPTSSPPRSMTQDYKPSEVDYDTPSKTARKQRGDDLDYDTPSSRLVPINNLCDFSILRVSNCPDNANSDRSSGVSLDSSMTFSSSNSIRTDPYSGQTTSGNFSARSSFDISAQDYYDVPPSRSTKQIPSRDSGVDQDYDQPKKCASVRDDDYDVPQLQDSAYDSPKHGSLISKYDSPIKDVTASNVSCDDYDRPRPYRVKSIYEDYDSPRSRRLSSNGEYDVPTSRPTSTDDPWDEDTLKARPKHGSVYDVPPQVTRDSVLSTRSDSSDGLDDSRLSTCSLDSSGMLDTLTYPDLPLTLDSAMDLFVKLQQDVKTSSLNLLSHVTSTWRKAETMERKLYDVKHSCVAVVDALRAFVQFSQGALANSARVADKKLPRKLWSQLQPLQEKFETIHNCATSLEHLDWNIAYLTEHGESLKPDYLTSIINGSKDVMIDIRKIASTIQGNSSLLFRKTFSTDGKNMENSRTMKSADTKPVSPYIQQRPLPLPPSDDQSSDVAKKSSKKIFGESIGGYIDEYDYVHLSSRENSPDEIFDNVKYDEITSSNCEDSSAPTSRDLSVNSVGVVMEINDQHIILYYDQQIDRLSTHLTDAIDSFFTCVESNDPPQTFVTRSKFVILAAHKLVYAGDTMHRNVMHRRVRDDIVNYANELCDRLKDCVSATKIAALQHPSVVAMQEMVDQVVKVSQSAKKLRLLVKHTAECCHT